MDHRSTIQTREEDLLAQLAGAERELAELRAEIEHAHRLATLGTLAGTIAHEFNNILTPVLSYAQFALDHPNDRELTTKALQRAASGAQRAATIASVLLGFAGKAAGSSGGEQAGDETRAEVHDVVRETLLCLARDPAQDGIVVRIEVQAGCVVAASPVTVQQILLNLIMNAHRAMRPDGGHLRISARTLMSLPVINQSNTVLLEAQNTSSRLVFEPPPSRGDFVPSSRSHASRVVRIEIEDTGCGIRADRLTTLFTPFATRHPAPPMTAPDPDPTSSPLGRPIGTGLGLTICKRLVEGIGGRIEVRSEVGVGTRFTITLPAAVGGGSEREQGAGSSEQ